MDGALTAAEKCRYVSPLLDSDGNSLRFPRRHGGHTGDDLAALVKPANLQSGIGEKLGSFIVDNAAGNGKFLEPLQRSFPSINTQSDRVICFKHVTYLVVETLLLGEGVSTWEKSSLDLEASEEPSAMLWSLKGVIRKLHKLVGYVKRDDAHREVLLARMRATKTSDGELFIGVPLSDGGV
ncbi:hypothetical protein V2A60_008441 [Cordyceps javanica]